MQFFEKLDFLMNVTNTSNSALALNIKLDPSHISRLRRGERSALKNENCIGAMAAYFSRHCEHDYQQKAIAEALELGSLPNGESHLSDCIAKWLITGSKSGTDTVESFLSGLSKIKSRQTVSVLSITGGADSGHQKSDTAVFFGIEGKRQAVLEFLSDAVAKGKPLTLLLFSDEATDWMSENRNFALQWSYLMSQFLTNGGRIKIIHTVSRDLDEMLSAISQWMPLYMSGSIEPYYYPKKRDGVFKRTLFIAPNVSAVISTSVGSTVNKAANVLLRDKFAIASYEREFREYLSLCRPLMRIFTPKDEKAYFESLHGFEKEQSDAIIKTASLSLLTMPENLFFAIMSRQEGVSEACLDNQKKRAALFEKNLSVYSFTEIITLPDIDTVTAGGIMVSLSDMLLSGKAFYTAEEFIRHLEHIVKLLGKYKNFHVSLSGSADDESYMVYVKEDIGAVVAKITPPPAILVIGENNLKAAFWDYLKSLTGSKAVLSRGREETLAKLSEYIVRLKKAAASS